MDKDTALDSHPGMLAGAVAGAFGLGPPVAALQPVVGGRSHRSWRLRTTGGEWAVKVLNRSREAWWRDGYRIATRIELTASTCGISMPRPMPPLHPTAPLLADVTIDGAVSSVRVHEWVDACSTSGAGPDVAPWVGETLAMLHALPVRLAVTEAVVHEPHEVDEWRDWLSAVPEDVPTDFVTAVRAHLPDIARAKRILDQDRRELRDRLTPVFTHRDVKPDNVLRTATGPVLVDWDEAGLDFAEWEVTRAALAFSRDGDGWNRPQFDQVVRTYQTVSGRRIPATRASFAGVLRHQLGAAAFLLFRALGHRRVTPAERTDAYGHTQQFLTELRRSLQHLPTWTQWLTSGKC